MQHLTPQYQHFLPKVRPLSPLPLPTQPGKGVSTVAQLTPAGVTSQQEVRQPGPFPRPADRVLELSLLQGQVVQAQVDLTMRPTVDPAQKVMKVQQIVSRVKGSRYSTIPTFLAPLKNQKKLDSLLCSGEV